VCSADRGSENKPQTRSRTLRAHDHRYPTHPRGRSPKIPLFHSRRQRRLLDRRVREPKDLEELYGLPLLGVVPESSALSRSAKGKKDAREALPASEAEAFHLIRAHLRYFNVDRELRTLMVASAAPGDGKTTVARHLAGAAARMGSRVLLLEADLRRPTIALQLDVSSGPGVADVLIGAVPLNEATQTVDLGLPGTDGSGARSFDVLVAGASLPPNPGELIESHAMESLLLWVRVLLRLRGGRG